MEQFKNELIRFGCDNDEIEKFINIKKTGIINCKNNNYALHTGLSRQRAEDTLEDIIAGRDRTLTETQKKLLKDENSFKKKITHDEYIKLSAGDKMLYRQCDNTFADEYETILFLQEFIKKHKTNAIAINLIATLKVTNPGDYVTINFTNTSIGNKTPVTIEKIYGDVDIPRMNITAIPLVEIHPTLKCIFRKFDEHKFTSNLKPSILNRLHNNMITMYFFKQTKEMQDKVSKLKNIAKRRIIDDQPMGLTQKELDLVRKPITMSSSNKAIPEGYELMINTERRLKPEYESELKEVAEKTVNTTDMLYLIDYLLNI